MRIAIFVAVVALISAVAGSSPTEPTTRPATKPTTRATAFAGYLVRDDAPSAVKDWFKQLEDESRRTVAECTARADTLKAELAKEKRRVPRGANDKRAKEAKIEQLERQIADSVAMAETAASDKFVGAVEEKDYTFKVYRIIAPGVVLRQRPIYAATSSGGFGGSGVSGGGGSYIRGFDYTVVRVPSTDKTPTNRDATFRGVMVKLDDIYRDELFGEQYEQFAIYERDAFVKWAMSYVVKPD